MRPYPICNIFNSNWYDTIEVLGDLGHDWKPFNINSDRKFSN